MFSKKKAQLDDLLNELSVAKQTLDDEIQTLDDVEQRYIHAQSDYIRSKHGYENALANYIRNGGTEYAQKEYQARALYDTASKLYSASKADYYSAQKRVKKAKKVYEKLQKLVAQKENAQMGQ